MFIQHSSSRNLPIFASELMRCCLLLAPTGRVCFKNVHLVCKMRQTQHITLETTIWDTQALYVSLSFVKFHQSSPIQTTVCHVDQSHMVAGLSFRCYSTDGMHFLVFPSDSERLFIYLCMKVQGRQYDNKKMETM